MSNPIDLTQYKNQTYLELCLDLVKEAHEQHQAGEHELVGTLLSDILETFGDEPLNQPTMEASNNIYAFVQKASKNHS